MPTGPGAFPFCCFQIALGISSLLDFRCPTWTGLLEWLQSLTVAAAQKFFNVLPISLTGLPARWLCFLIHLWWVWCKERMEGVNFHAPKYRCIYRWRKSSHVKKESPCRSKNQSTPGQWEIDNTIYKWKGKPIFYYFSSQLFSLYFTTFLTRRQLTFWNQ